MTESNPAPGNDPQPASPEAGSDPTTPGGSAPAGAVAGNAKGAASPPPTKKRRRGVRILLTAIGCLVLLLVLFVLLAPTIASTGPVRSFVLGKVNAGINGKVDVADWSLGWTSGLKASGVRISDASGRQILQLSSLTSELTLLDVIRGNYSLGDVVVDGLDFLLRREADGQFNFAKLARAKPPSAQPPAPAAPAQPAPADATAAAQPSKLPNLTGNVVLRNSRGTYEDVTKSQTVQFASIDGSVKIPDINGPIENALTVVAATPDGQRGTLKVGGSVDVIENNEVRVETANVDEKVEIVGVALPAVAAMLPPGTIDTMRGDANGVFQVKLTAGQGGFVEAEVTSDGFAASGPALNGDTLAAKRFVLTVPRTSIDMSSGYGSWANWPIRTGGADTAQPIKVALVHDGYEDTVTIALSATPQSLMNLGGNLKPGANGQLDIAVNADLGGYAKQLPHLFQEQDGRRLQSAKLAHTIQITLVPDRATIHEKLDLTEISLVNADGSVAKLEPIRQELRADTLGGGWAMPELRDIRLVLNSGFANAEFAGAEIGNLKGTATGDLARTQAELGQFIPMDEVRLGGTFAVTLTSSGDVASATAPAKLAAGATFTNLELDGVAGFEDFRQGHTHVEAAAEVLRDAAGVKALRDVRVVARTGDTEQALTLDSELAAAVEFVNSTTINPATQQAETVRVAEVPKYELRRLIVELPAAQRDFPGQFAALREQGLEIESGVLSLAGSGSYRASAITFDVKGGAQGVTLTSAAAVTSTASAALAQVPPAAGRSAVLRDYTLSIDAAGSYAPGEGGTSTTRLVRLAIADNQKMLSLSKGEQELVIATGGAGGVQPAGEIRLGADLKKLNDVMQSFSADAARAAGAAEQPKAAELTSGRLDASLKLGPAPDAGLLALNGRVDLTSLTVRTEAEPIENEKLGIALRARSRADFSYVNVDEATVSGRLMNAKVTDTVIDLGASGEANAPPLAVVPRANAVIELTNLRDLHALIRAISPPEPVVEPARAQPADAVEVPDGEPAAPDPRAPEPRRLRFDAPGTARDGEPPVRGDEVIGGDVIGRRPGAPKAAEPRRELPAGPADPDGSVALAPADDAPAPPAQIRSGTATIRLTLGREGEQIVLTPEVIAKDLSFKAGSEFKQVGDLSFTTAVRMLPARSAPADATFVQRLRELTIPSLVLRGAGAEVKLEQPLVVKDPAVAFRSFGASATQPGNTPRPAGGAAVLSAILNATVNLGETLPILEAWQGAAPGTLYPYAGALTVRQELTTSGGAFRLNGRADVNDFAMTGEGGSDFAERRVGFANTVTLDPKSSVLKIENLALAMENTKAVMLSAGGTIHEFDTARRFEDMAVRIEYDAAKLWDVLRPMMDPETGGKSLEEVTLTGKRLQEIRIEGSYPAGDPNAIRSVRATGGLALDTLATRGLDVSRVDLRFLLENGVILLEHADAAPATRQTVTQPDGAVAQAGESGPPGADCNGGKLSFHGLTVDLTGEHPRLDIPEGHPLIRGASINPVVADSIIGRFVNPAFAGADRAKGILDVTVERCTGLALDSAMQSPDPRLSGRAELTWTLTDLMLGQPELVALVTKLKPNALNEPGFNGEIKDGKIVIEGGQVYSDMTFQIDEYALGFNGGIGLAQNNLVNFSVALPPALFAAIDDKFERVVPKEGYKVALTGTTNNWIGNATNSILPIVADLGARAAIGGLFDRESDEEKAERRKRERARREARERGEAMPADPAEKPAGEDAAPPPDDPAEPRPDDVIGRPRGEAGDRDKPAAEPDEPKDPLGDLLERAIGGGKRETDAEKKARREKVRKERREREERERQQREQQSQPRQ